MTPHPNAKSGARRVHSPGRRRNSPFSLTGMAKHVSEHFSGLGRILPGRHACFLKD